MAKAETSPSRGMRDLLPDEVSLRSKMTDEILATYHRRGFTKIETPAVENLDRLLGSGGGDNEKLVFKILKRGEKFEDASLDGGVLADLGLRFDLTVPLARYYANNFSKLPPVLRSIQIGPVWRAERPQKGRYRQFVQCDIDIIGEPSVIAELELISTSLEAATSLGVEGLTLRFNDRNVLDILLLAAEVPLLVAPSVLVTLDKLDKIGFSGVSTELNSLLGDSSSVSRLLNLFEPLASYSQVNPDLLGRLGVSDKVIGDLMAIESLAKLDDSVQFRFDPTVIRGMGYYTGPIFELGVPSFGFSVGAGGRYDEMMSRFGRPSPACGFSLGFERLVLYLESRGSQRYSREPIAHIRCANPSDYTKAKNLADALANKGIVCMIEGSTRKLDAVLKTLRSQYSQTNGSHCEYEILVVVDGANTEVFSIGGTIPESLEVAD